MKIIFVAVFAVVALVACASSAAMPDGRYDEPLYENMSYEKETSVDETNKDQDSDALEPHVRERRFTCDVFSFSSKWVTPNHSACALRCVGMGRKGGRCVNMICKCRGRWW